MTTIKITLPEGTSTSGLAYTIQDLLQTRYDAYASNVLTAHTFEAYCQKYWSDMWALYQLLDAGEYETIPDGQ